MSLSYSTAEKPTNALRRRKAGEVWWRNMLNSILESERADRLKLRRIADKYPTDAELQRLVAQLMDEKNERMVLLHELLQFRDSTKKGADDEPATKPAPAWWETDR